MADTENRRKAVGPLIKHTMQLTKNLPELEIVALRNSGLTNKEIGRRFGVSVSLVERRIRKAKQHGHHVTVCFKPDRDSALIAKKTAQAHTVQRLIESGKTVVQACAKAGITPPTYYSRLKKFNHRVVSVDKIDDEMDVTCLRVPNFENFAVSAGVFVHNCAGAFFNAINSDEKVTISSHNSAVMTTNQGLDRALNNERPPVEIVLPSTGYDRSKVFVG